MSKNTRWSGQQKIQIVMEFINTNIAVSELCRKHNLAPTTFYQWKDRFLEAGRTSLSGNTDRDRTTDGRARKEIESLQRLVGELTMANSVLKKTLEGRKR